MKRGIITTLLLINITGCASSRDFYTTATTAIATGIATGLAARQLGPDKDRSKRLNFIYFGLGGAAIGGGSKAYMNYLERKEEEVQQNEASNLYFDYQEQMKGVQQ